MKKWMFLPALLVQGLVCLSQGAAERLSRAIALLEKDTQMTTATIALYVVDAQSGQVVYDINGRVGLAPASTQKIITSVAAYALLGQDFRYKTEFGYNGSLKNGVLNGFLFLRGTGDPTFGSWRFQETREDVILDRLYSAVSKAGIKSFGGLITDTTGWEPEAVPDGWIWQDIGNYYGAGAHSLNWRENQYDLSFRSGRILGAKASITAIKPALQDFKVSSQVTTAASGTGDRTFIYFVPDGRGVVVKGTIPVNEDHFVVSGSIPAPERQFNAIVDDMLLGRGLQHNKAFQASEWTLGNKEQQVVLYTHQSPPFNSIIYWFLRKSINLYGEALVKTIALKQSGSASTEGGVEQVRAFWQQHDLDPRELHIMDGSGLSPQNRITAHAEVTALGFALNQEWFPAFYEALPVYNGMKMKSGSIGGARAFCGYQTAHDGHRYIFSMIINNYDGSGSQTVQKMFKVLDELK